MAVLQAQQSAPTAVDDDEIRAAAMAWGRHLDYRGRRRFSTVRGNSAVWCSSNVRALFVLVIDLADCWHPAGRVRSYWLHVAHAARVKTGDCLRCAVR